MSNNWDNFLDRSSGKTHISGNRSLLAAGKKQNK